jgi:hypothetical protein
MPQSRGILRANVRGIKRIARKPQQTEDKVIGALGKALFAEGKEVIEEAAKQVPVDTGALLRSRFVTPPIKKKDEVKVVCGFGTDSVVNPKTGQPTKDYAIYVHERLDVKHPVGKAKFLEDPLNEARVGLEKRLAARVITILGR